MRGLPTLSTQNTKGSTALMLACQESHSAVAKLLLVFGADLGAQDHNGATPLMRACSVDNGSGASLVRLLLQLSAHHHGAVNVQTTDGTTALMIAAVRGHVEVVRTLLRVGRADTRVVNEDGDSALVLARRCGGPNSEQVGAHGEHGSTTHVQWPMCVLRVVCVWWVGLCLTACVALSAWL